MDLDDVRVPLPSNIDEANEDVHNFFGGDDWLDLDGYILSPQASETCREAVEPPLSPARKRDLKSMIEDSCLSTQAVFNFHMPWERPGIKTVIASLRGSSHFQFCN